MASKIGAVTVRLASSCSRTDGNFAEPANRENRAVDRQRRNDDIDARSIGQAGIAHRRGFIHAPADVGHDLVDDVAQVGVVLENYVGLLQYAASLDIYLSISVDQDVVDRWHPGATARAAPAQRLRAATSRARRSLSLVLSGVSCFHDEVLNDLLYLRPGPDVLEGSQLSPVDLPSNSRWSVVFSSWYALGGNTNTARSGPMSHYPLAYQGRRSLCFVAIFLLP